MKTTIGLAITLMLSGTSAFAQGGPPEKMQGAPGTHEQGQGERGSGRGPDVQQRAAPRSAERGEAQPSKGEPRGGGRGPDAQQRTAPRSAERGEVQPSKGELGKHAQQNRDERVSQGRAEKNDQPQRGEREDKNSKKTQQPEDRARKERSSSEGQASGESGRSADKKDAGRLGERDGVGRKAVQSDDRKEQVKRVELSRDKRDRVKTVFRERGNLKHRTNANVDLRVGTRLPHDWDFVPVPVSIVDIVPEYDGYLFAYVDDDYVICDPETYEIVAVIPVSDGPSYASDEPPGRCPDRISLNEDERDLILHSIHRENRIDVAHLTVGWSVPRDIELYTFSDPVLSRVSELGSCRYFVAEDQIAIVSPDEERVVYLIDRS